MAGPCGCRRGRCAALFVLALILVIPHRATAAPVVETRDFTVFVDGKAGGDAHMTINKHDDGSIIMTCDTDIRVRVKVGILSHEYTYSLRRRSLERGPRPALREHVQRRRQALRRHGRGGR